MPPKGAKGSGRGRGLVKGGPFRSAAAAARGSAVSAVGSTTRVVAAKAVAAQGAAVKKRPAAASRPEEDDEAMEADGEEEEEQEEEEEEDDKEKDGEIEDEEVEAPKEEPKEVPVRPSETDVEPAGISSSVQRGIASSPASGSGYKDLSPAAAAARAMQVVTKSPVGKRNVAAITDTPGKLRVAYIPATSGRAPLSEEMTRLRQDGLFTDAVVISADGRFPVHRAVVAAHSEILAERMQPSRSQSEANPVEMNLNSIGNEAAEFVVRWLYGEIDEVSYQPSTSQVNEEVLRASCELGLPRLSELCALRLAADVETSNIVSRIRLCEDCGLPRFRGALVGALVGDPKALDAVAQDSNTVTHPVLMRELLSIIAGAKLKEMGNSD